MKNKNGYSEDLSKSISRIVKKLPKTKTHSVRLSPGQFKRLKINWGTLTKYVARSNDINYCLNAYLKMLLSFDKPSEYEQSMIRTLLEVLE